MSPLSVVEPRRPVAPTRGPLLTAATIVRDYFTEPDGHAMVSERWVRANAPNKVRLSYNRVAWYRDDVEAWIAALRQAK